MKKLIISVMISASLSAQIYECKKIYLQLDQETINQTSKIIFDMKKVIIQSKEFDTIQMKYEKTEVNGDTRYTSNDLYDPKSFVYHRRNSPYLFIYHEATESYIFQECKRIK